MGGNGGCPGSDVLERHFVEQGLCIRERLETSVHGDQGIAEESDPRESDLNQTPVEGSAAYRRWRSSAQAQSSGYGGEISGGNIWW